MVKEVQRAQFCIVLDTNVWRSNSVLLLSGPIGRALLHAIRRKGGRIGLPEVIERELGKNLVDLGLDAAEGAERSALILGSLTGTAPRIWKPTAEELSVLIHRELRRLEDLFVRVEFSLEHARAALDRVIAGLPPNSPKDQQYKDSAIWEALLTLAADYEIIFVTADKAFFNNRNPKEGLAAALRDELAARSVRVRIFHLERIGDLLQELQEGLPELNEAFLLAAVERKLIPHAQRVLVRESFSLGDRLSNTLATFFTPNPREIAITFDVTYALRETTAQGRQAAKYFFYGSAIFDSDKGEILELQPISEDMTWLQADGQRAGVTILHDAEEVRPENLVR